MRHLRTQLAAAAIAGVSLLSACGGSTSTATSSSDTLPTLADGADEASASPEATDEPQGELSEADQDRLLAEYQACMADFGVDDGVISIEDGGQSIESESSDDVDADEQLPDLEKLEEAMAECDPILDQVFGQFELSPEEEAEAADIELKLERCMNDKGFDFGDETATFDLSDEEFQAFEKAFAECDTELGFGENMMEAEVDQ